jgi:hypothetical protein
LTTFLSLISRSIVATPWPLDGVQTHKATLDDVQEYNSHVQGMLRLLDSVSAAHIAEAKTHRTALDQALATVAQLEAENAEFLSMLASGKALDSVSFEAIRPIVLPIGPAERLRREIGGFKTAQVAGYEKLDAVAEESPEGKALSSIISRFKP